MCLLVQERPGSCRTEAVHGKVFNDQFPGLILIHDDQLGVFTTHFYDCPHVRMEMFDRLGLGHDLVYETPIKLFGKLGCSNAGEGT